MPIIGRDPLEFMFDKLQSKQGIAEQIKGGNLPCRISATGLSYMTARWRIAIV